MLYASILFNKPKLEVLIVENRLRSALVPGIRFENSYMDPQRTTYLSPTGSLNFKNLHRPILERYLSQRISAEQITETARIYYVATASIPLWHKKSKSEIPEVFRLR